MIKFLSVLNVTKPTKQAGMKTVLLKQPEWNLWVGPNFINQFKIFLTMKIEIADGNN